MSINEIGPGTSPASARQLRREAEKARELAGGTYSEEDRNRLIEIAATLDREAVMIERALARKLPESGPPSWMVAPPFRQG